MTQVITRYFDSAARARLVEKEFALARFQRRIYRVYTDADSMRGSLGQASVQPATIDAYADKLANGGAVVMVKAGHKPLRVAQIARDLMAKLGAADGGDLVEEVFVRDTAKPGRSIMSDHPLMLSRDKDPSRTDYHMADWPIPLIKRRNPNMDSLMKPHVRMANWPLALTFRKNPREEFLFHRHARMADVLLPLTILRNPNDNFAFARHARMADGPMRLISQRKPYTRTKIARHARMANWPFPHLMNGKQRTNSLMPAAPRMANVFLPLLSQRKPVDRFAFPRHARMAPFPISLLSSRKPVTASAIPKHGRMAAFPLPLVISNPASTPDGRGFSFSRMLGMRTISKR